VLVLYTGLRKLREVWTLEVSWMRKKASKKQMFVMMKITVMINPVVKLCKLICHLLVS